MSQTHKRKKKLIDSTLQLRLIAAFLCISCITSLFQVILLNRSLLEMSRNLSKESQVVLAEVPTILLTNVMVTLLILVPLSFAVGILVTHRVAGPAWRLKHYLDEIIETGRVDQPVKLRQADEFQNLAQSLNRALARLTENVGLERGANKDAPHDPEGPSDPEGSDDGHEEHDQDEREAA